MALADTEQGQLNQVDPDDIAGLGAPTTIGPAIDARG
jgi:hypothetical protein